MVMMWLLMKCKRSIFTVTLPSPVGKVFSYWVMVSIIQILVWLCSSTLVIFPKRVHARLKVTGWFQVLWDSYQAGWMIFTTALMKIYWIYMFGCFDKPKVLWQLHTREINQTGETWECDPAHALCLITPSHYVFVFTSMASLPRLFPYFVYFAPIVFRGIVSMLIPAEIWGRRWGRITEGAICGSSSYQHHHQYHHFNHNIIIAIILLRDTRKKI